MASQDARLSKLEADFKQQQSEMTNKIDTVLKAITDRMAGALPSDTVKNPKLNVNSTTSVLSARSHNAQPTPMIRSIPSKSIPINKVTPVIARLRKKIKKERATPKTPTPLHTMKNKEIHHNWR
ncbi:hypothetical protein Tco_0783881 [Tanacetum coccineum]